MRKAIWGVTVLLAVCVGVSAQAQASQPGPEARQLEGGVGNWQYDGAAKASPLGPAAKIAGKQTGRMLAGGFALELTGEETGVFGDIKFGQIEVYDTAAKAYRYLGYQNDGTTWQGSYSLTGNVQRFSGTQTVNGVSYHIRGNNTFAADGKSFTQQVEVSTDGKTWAPWVEIRFTKVS